MSHESLTITKERVLEAAKKDSQAAAVLKTLFPEVFQAAASLTPGTLVVNRSGRRGVVASKTVSWAISKHYGWGFADPVSVIDLEDGCSYTYRSEQSMSLGWSRIV